MRFDEWRALLTVSDSKPNRDDEFWAICPCHDDHEASLHLTIGNDGGIRMKCFVCGAGNAKVAKAMGKRPGDAICDAMTGEDLGQRNAQARPAKPKREAKKPKPAGHWKVGDVWKLGKGRETPYTLVRFYDYQAEDGRTVMQKARFEHMREDGGKEKYFAFRSVGTDGGWYATTGIYAGLLYHLPALNAAKREGRTVYIVEGEKDADNLAALGYCAISSAYGGGKGKLEGKWLPDYTERLRGAERVIVLPDNDGAGEGLAQWICKHIRDAVGELSILRLVDSLDDADRAAFDKGDFTDWAGLRRKRGRGRREICAEFDALSAAAPVWTPGNILSFPRQGGETEKSTSLNEHAHLSEQPAGGGGDDGEGGDNGDPYYDVAGYSIKYGRLCRVDPKWGAQILCDFVPIPKETVTRDDGGELRTEYVIGGKYADEELPDARIESEELEAMKWPSNVWQFRGNIRAKKGAREYVRDAIMRAGQKIAVRRTVYGHTGMRVVDGVPCYLYNGGAVGAQGVSVELQNNLRYYCLDLPDGVTERSGARGLYMLMSGIPGRIVLPLLAQAFLAPLYSTLEDMGDPPSYVVYLVGRTGSFKSTLVGYIESMFGKFYLRRHTASFQETANQVRDKTYYAKDALFVVDDYNPETDMHRRNQMDATAQAVITAIADRAERGGLTADRKMRRERPARCTCIMTGEQLPGLNNGRMLRLYVIDVARGEIAGDTELLNMYKRDATDCQYRAAMRGYIERLLARFPNIQDELRERLEEAHRTVYGDATAPREHARILEAGAHLMTGCGLLIDYMIDVGEIDADMRENWMHTCWEAVRANMLAQEMTIEEANPVRIYMDAIRSLVRMRSVRVLDTDETSALSGSYVGPGMVGYRDASFYYFETGAIDRAVHTALKDRGVDIGPNYTAIRKMMLEQGICFGYKSDPCRNKTIRGHQQRYLWISRETIDGVDEAAKKAKEAEFVPVPDAEQTLLPFDK